MALPHFKNVKRNFKNCGPYRWEVTDKYGDTLSADIVRDNTINDVLDLPNSVEVIYTIGLKRSSREEQGWGLYNIIFEPRYQELKLYPLSDGDIRVTLPCKSLEDCEYLIGLICKGNHMEVQPAYLEGFELK